MISILLLFRFFKLGAFSKSHFVQLKLNRSLILNSNLHPRREIQLEDRQAKTKGHLTPNSSLCMYYKKNGKGKTECTFLFRYRMFFFPFLCSWGFGYCIPLLFQYLSESGFCILLIVSSKVWLSRT